MPKNNVNPDHYKVAGRERPGDGIPHAEQQETLAKSRARGEKASRTRVPPAPEDAGAVGGARKSPTKSG